MSWLILAFASAVFLGFYDLAKKKSVQDNAVRPVLCLCSAFYALFMLPVLLSGHCEPLSLHDHLLLMVKAVIVGLSWLFTYNAIAHMPLSISTTIRALAPLFTIMIAVGFMGERPFALQWVGIALCVCSYIGLSLAGRKEMGHFFSNGWAEGEKEQTVPTVADSVPTTEIKPESTKALKDNKRDSYYINRFYADRGFDEFDDIKEFVESFKEVKDDSIDKVYKIALEDQGFVKDKECSQYIKRAKKNGETINDKIAVLRSILIFDFKFG